MSRWIAKGLKGGIHTTRFPETVTTGEEGAPSTVRVRLQGLNPAVALAASSRCPTSAISTDGSETAGELRFDAGACVLCGRCSREFPSAFTQVRDPRVAVVSRDRLRATFSWDEEHELAPVSLQATAQLLQQATSRLFRHSLHIRHVDAGSCNGCESELQMLSSPYVDLQRLGIFFTPTPRHADVLLVTGVVTHSMTGPLLETYAAMPSPKLVIAAGACAISGGSFENSSLTNGPLDRLLAVDAYIPGCPPTPQALLHGLLLAVGRAGERYRAGQEEPDGA